MNLNMVLRNSTLEQFACILQSKRAGMFAIEVERTWFHFFSDVSAAVALVVY